jgi:rhodanese-related sulfurtransferase
MTKMVKEVLAEARSAVPQLAPAVDVRDGPEVQQNGHIKGALNVPRGMLEFRADPDSPYYNPVFTKNKTIVLHCASVGARRSQPRRCRKWATRPYTMAALSRTLWRPAVTSRSHRETELSRAFVGERHQACMVRPHWRADAVMPAFLEAGLGER